MRRDRRKELLIADLSVCTPKSALGDRYAPGRWKLLPYEHADFSGVMLGAIGSRDAAPLRLPLKVRGWYDLYVGLYRTYEEIGVQLRLTRDRSYRKFRVPVIYNFPTYFQVVEELFWKADDLTDQSIHIAPLKVFNTDIDNYIAYFRLRPLSAARVRAIKRERESKQTRRLFAMTDHSDFIATYSITSRQDMAGEVDVYRNTDFAGICWEFIKGGQPVFPVAGVAERDFPRNAMIPVSLYENYRRVWRHWKQPGKHPLRIARELTRSAGLELHVSHRMCEASQPPYEDFCPTDFLRGRFEQYCRLADGAPVQRYSYAKPALQDHMIRIYAEAARYGVDGFHMLTIRGGPMVLYEDEMIDRFRELYGKRTDPRTLPLSDKRIFAVRAQLFGEYLRRLREAVHLAARAAGHKPPIISIHGLNNFQACRHFGIDFAAWAREGLVDRIVACAWGAEWGSDTRHPWPDFDLAFYRRCVQGTKTQLYAQVPPPTSRRAQTPENCREHYRRRAEKLYAGGVEGLYFWDTPWRHCHAHHFNVLSVLGHKRNVGKRIDETSDRTREVLLEKLCGIELAKDRFPPWLGG